MAKKQVIWSRSAKKDIYWFLEMHLRKYNDKKLTALFFRLLQRKISLLSKGKLPLTATSGNNISAFTADDCLILSEEQEERIIIHNASLINGQGL